MDVEDSLDVLFTDLGFDVRRVRPLEINSLAQDAGFVLTEEEGITELQAVMSDVGMFPTIKTLIGISDLVLQIQKTGGQNHYRRLLGCRPPVKPNNYWSL